MITEKAPAKINLGLDICGRHEDGYHELAMVMASVDLNDYVTVTEDTIIMTSNSHRMPRNAKNDAVKAAQLVKERYGIKADVQIELEKNIPICAGLGGGSSDAAASLRALDRLWSLDMSPEEMIEFGFALGTDVPYCLSAGCAYIAGRDEQVECLSICLPGWSWSSLILGCPLGRFSRTLTLRPFLGWILKVSEQL